ncbi:macrolide phosphotransferase [Hazenella coriacea]|uniref:Macrolide phosphotransferase n=1 Tax=Hazenella coriacea TaxID=1179467 RepID=A0A4R3L1M9_9BACL|nr:macrolide phosphotransferase [Hazenella coriacea]
MKPEQVIEIAKKHDLIIKEDSIQLNESGLDFLVVFATDTLGEKWVLRFPRREDVIPTKNKEKKILDLVEPQLSIQAPKWEIFTDEMIAYKQLKGVPVGTIDPVAKAYVWEIDEKNVPDQYHETLAKAMVSLHQMDQQEAKSMGLTIENPDEIRSSLKDRMEKVKVEFGVSQPLWDRWQSWLEDDSLWPQQVGLVHGDLHPGHILIDENTHVTGFIDWTEAAVTDISRDFVIHYRAFGKEALDQLIMYYEKAGGYVWPLMANHIIELDAAYPVGIAEFALKSGLEEYHQMAKETLGVS